MIGRALKSFVGIGRRFNDLGDVAIGNGACVRLIDDYGHHPRELEAVFAAARGGGRISGWWLRFNRIVTVVLAISLMRLLRC